MSSRVVAAAPAKVNLWLRVFGRDTKGFHAIESLFQLISIADELRIERTARGVTLAGVPADLGATKDNLAVRAAERFFAASGIRGGASITLTKRIPWNAGLGGGSSDAATTLAALNALYDDRLTLEELMTLGAELGSDVPFFLSGAALALGWGRGDRLLGLPALPPRPLLVVPPAAPVRTADAYAWLDRGRMVEDTWEFAAVVPSEHLASWDEVRRRSHNDFEPVVAGRLPAIGHWLDRLRATEAFLVRLCGSGGAVAAFYDTAAKRDAAWQRLGAEAGILRGETLTVPPSLAMED